MAITWILFNLLIKIITGKIMYQEYLLVNCLWVWAMAGQIHFYKSFCHKRDSTILYHILTFWLIFPSSDIVFLFILIGYKSSNLLLHLLSFLLSMCSARRYLLSFNHLLDIFIRFRTHLDLFLSLVLPVPQIFMHFFVSFEAIWLIYMFRSRVPYML